MTTKTALSFEEFADAQGGRCPFCGTEDTVDFNSFEYESNTVFQPATCMSCKGEWTAAYQLDRALLHRDQDGQLITDLDYLPNALPTDEQIIAAYSKLHDGLSNLIAGGRLMECDIFDDFKWLVDSLAELDRLNPVSRGYRTQPSEEETA